MPRCASAPTPTTPIRSGARVVPPGCGSVAMVGPSFDRDRRASKVGIDGDASSLCRRQRSSFENLDHVQRVLHADDRLRSLARRSPRDARRRARDRDQRLDRAGPSRSGPPRPTRRRTGSETSRRLIPRTPRSPRSSSSGASASAAQLLASTEASAPSASRRTRCHASAGSTGIVVPANGPSTTSKLLRVRAENAPTSRTGPRRPVSACSGYTAMSTRGPPLRAKYGDGSEWYPSHGGTPPCP